MIRPRPATTSKPPLAKVALAKMCVSLQPAREPPPNATRFRLGTKAALSARVMPHKAAIWQATSR